MRFIYDILTHANYNKNCCYGLIVVFRPPKWSSPQAVPNCNARREDYANFQRISNILEENIIRPHITQTPLTEVLFVLREFLDK